MLRTCSPHLPSCLAKISAAVHWAFAAIPDAPSSSRDRDTQPHVLCWRRRSSRCRPCTTSQEPCVLQLLANLMTSSSRHARIMAVFL
jgi:hypothetical protein